MVPAAATTGGSVLQFLCWTAEATSWVSESQQGIWELPVAFPDLCSSSPSNSHISNQVCVLSPLLIYKNKLVQVAWSPGVGFFLSHDLFVIFTCGRRHLWQIIGCGGMICEIMTFYIFSVPAIPLFVTSHFPAQTRLWPPQTQGKHVTIELEKQNKL